MDACQMFNALKCIVLEKCFIMVVVITSEGPLLMTEDIYQQCLQIVTAHHALTPP